MTDISFAGMSLKDAVKLQRSLKAQKKKNKKKKDPPELVMPNPASA